MPACGRAADQRVGAGPVEGRAFGAAGPRPSRSGRGCCRRRPASGAGTVRRSASPAGRRPRSCAGTAPARREAGRAAPASARTRAQRPTHVPAPIGPCRSAHRLARLRRERGAGAVAAGAAGGSPRRRPRSRRARATAIRIGTSGEEPPSSVASGVDSSCGVLAGCTFAVAGRVVALAWATLARCRRRCPARAARPSDDGGASSA